MNQAIFIGRLRETIKMKNYTILIFEHKRSYKNLDGEYESDLLPVYAYPIPPLNIENGDLVGVKGKLETMDGQLIIRAERFSILNMYKEQE